MQSFVFVAATTGLDGNGNGNSVLSRATADALWRAAHSDFALARRAFHRRIAALLARASSSSSSSSSAVSAPKGKGESSSSASASSSSSTLSNTKPYPPRWLHLLGVLSGASESALRAAEHWTDGLMARLLFDAQRPEVVWQTQVRVGGWVGG